MTATNGERAVPSAQAATAARAAKTNPSNLFGLDYRREAARFPRLPYPIVDVHSHVHGRLATPILAEAMSLYGIGSIYSMTALEQVETVRNILGDRVRFISVPDFAAADRRRAHGEAYAERIERYFAAGARIAKFWAAPRIVDMAAEAGEPGLFALDSPLRRDAMETASRLGMVFMTHVADPDTWFATRYANAARYGRKLDHYRPLEALLDRYHTPWIAAHFGGWPEDLAFLDGLLARHPNLHLDTSATKWVVREISRHPPEAVRDFLTRWEGRILFGSDIVTTDDHLVARDGKTEMAAKASTAEDAFDLYASRYWALRTLWELDHDGPSPISDPDLAMVDPARHGPADSPRLRGMRLPAPLLRSLYADAAARLLDPYHLSASASPARA